MTAALHVLPATETMPGPDTARDLDHLISQHTDRVHRAKLTAEATAHELAETQERARALQSALGVQQRDHQEAGRELAALVLTREIVGRAYASLGGS